MVYSLVPQVGDGELIVRATSGSTEYRIQRGFIGRPQMVAGARDTTNAAPPAQITTDSRFALALTYAPMSEYERARREKRRPADQPKASLAIVDLSSGQVTNVSRVRSFRTARESGTWVAYLLEAVDSSTAKLITGSGHVINRSIRGLLLLLPEQVNNRQVVEIQLLSKAKKKQSTKLVEVCWTRAIPVSARVKMYLAGTHFLFELPVPG